MCILVIWNNRIFKIWILCKKNLLCAGISDRGEHWYCGWTNLLYSGDCFWQIKHCKARSPVQWHCLHQYSYWCPHRYHLLHTASRVSFCFWYINAVQSVIVSLVQQWNSTSSIIWSCDLEQNSILLEGGQHRGRERRTGWQTWRSGMVVQKLLTVP